MVDSDHVLALAKKYAYSRPNNYRGDVKVVIAKPGQTSLSVVQRTRSGYRKLTNGEYVHNSYRCNFGWKNTYYQHAETVVAVPLEYWW